MFLMENDECLLGTNVKMKILMKDLTKWSERDLIHLPERMGQWKSLWVGWRDIVSCAGRIGEDLQDDSWLLVRYGSDGR